MTDTIIPFRDWPDARRYKVRDLIEQFGGQVRAYTGTGLQVAMPNVHAQRRTITGLLEHEGLRVIEQYLFPLGSDKPPEHLRNHGPYNHAPDRPGYWYIYQFGQADRAAERL